MASLLEQMWLDMEQMSAHVWGKKPNAAHLARRCLLCQPHEPIWNQPKPLSCLLPGHYPSDADYASLKAGGGLVKKLTVLGTQVDTQVCKEWLLFLGSLSYQFDSFATHASKHVIICLDGQESKEIKREGDQVTILGAHWSDADVCIVPTTREQWRKLHLILLQKVGRCSVLDIQKICQEQGIECHIHSASWKHASLFY